jgi:hypothetical protein
MNAQREEIFLSLLPIRVQNQPLPVLWLVVCVFFNELDFFLPPKQGATFRENCPHEYGTRALGRSHK